MENIKGKKNVTQPAGEEHTVIIGTGLGGLGPGGAASVAEMKNGKIVRLRPLHYDWKYDPKQLNAWKIEARGKTLEPRMKTLSPAFGTSYKKRVYSPNRESSTL